MIDYKEFDKSQVDKLLMYLALKKLSLRKRPVQMSLNSIEL